MRCGAAQTPSSGPASRPPSVPSGCHAGGRIVRCVLRRTRQHYCAPHRREAPGAQVRLADRRGTACDSRAHRRGGCRLRRLDRTSRTEIDLLRELRTRLTSDVVTGQVDVQPIAATAGKRKSRLGMNRLNDGRAGQRLGCRWLQSHSVQRPADGDEHFIAGLGADDRGNRCTVRVGSHRSGLGVRASRTSAASAPGGAGPSAPASAQYPAGWLRGRTGTDAGGLPFYSRPRTAAGLRRGTHGVLVRPAGRVRDVPQPHRQPQQPHQSAAGLPAKGERERWAVCCCAGGTG